MAVQLPTGCRGIAEGWLVHCWNMVPKLPTHCLYIAYTLPMGLQSREQYEIIQQ